MNDSPQEPARPTSSHDGQAFYTPEHLAEILYISRQQVIDLSRSGVIPHVRLGRYYRYSDAHLDELRQRREKSEARQKAQRAAEAWDRPARTAATQGEGN
ncbi:helix-turn-helix domain-containing protein [Knoellia sp. CPCC 206453]|uniref:helix-turn-helix domain-containing protein n=1 Tax=Knoellia pratensis TaxID=3404796 RepID=UPI003616FC66